MRRNLPGYSTGIVRSWKLMAALLCFAIPSVVQAQRDTTYATDTTNKKNGIFSKLVQAFTTDSLNDLTYSEGVIRNDAPFQRYKGKRIRNIIISRFEFGRAIHDSSRVISNFLVDMADRLHVTTKQQTIEKNLFFKKGDRVMPHLLADNERYLREQIFLNDARIVLRTAKGKQDQVDVFVITKDVLSLGGELSLLGGQSFEAIIKEENLQGSGNSLWTGIYYDSERSSRTGYRAEYRQRNINGTFIDLHGGFNTYHTSISSGRREEDHFFATLIKPLVSAYDRWTYALEFNYHHNKNRYIADSLFKSDFLYQAHSYDVWGGYLFGAKKAIRNLNDNRWRQFAGLRFFTTSFDKIPGKFTNNYYYRYADQEGVLAAFSVFKQEFYRTRYVYGFGRNEDLPEGSDVSIITGFTTKETRERSYFGLDFKRYYFTGNNSYIDFTARFGSYLYGEAFEDISTLFNVSLISPLKTLKIGWKQRYFLHAGFTKEFRTRLNSPLFLQSVYGLPMMTNGTVAADTRLTARGESIFFNDRWNLLGFHIAPIAGAGVSLLKPASGSFEQSDIFTVLTAGIRVRNENLVFGTIEARAHYFPNDSHQQNSFMFEIATNLQFRYLSQFIRKPDFIQNN